MMEVPSRVGIERPRARHDGDVVHTGGGATLRHRDRAGGEHVTHPSE